MGLSMWPGQDFAVLGRIPFAVFSVSQRSA
jgi:hypothetical protein